MNTKTRKQRVHDCTNTKARKGKGAYKHSDKQAKEYIPTLRHASKRVCTNTKTQKEKSIHRHWDTQTKEHTQTQRQSSKDCTQALRQAQQKSTFSANPKTNKEEYTQTLRQ